MSVQLKVIKAFNEIQFEQRADYDTQLFCNLLISNEAAKGNIVKFTTVERRLRECKADHNAKVAAEAQRLTIQNMY